MTIVRFVRLVTVMLMTVALVIPASGGAFAATQVGGIISSDTTWTAAGSPYIVTSKVQIPLGVNLTIAAGALVQRASTYSGDMFLVVGRLSIEGTEAAPAVVDGGGAAYSDLICAGATSPTEGGRVIIDHAVLERSRDIFWGGGCGTDYNGSLSLTNSLIRDIYTYNYLGYPIRDSVIEGNTFVRASGFDLLQEYRSGGISVTNNRFVSRSTYFGTFADDFWVEDSNASGAAPPNVTANVFENVGQVAVRLNYAHGGLNAIGNYWGTTNESVIRSMIWDSSDDVTVGGTIPFDPWLNAEPDSVPPPYVMPLLQVARTGDGSGTVTSSPAGISCGSDCSEPYDPGTVVKLTAGASNGSDFSGWSGACTGLASTCSVTMTQARSVTASFAIAQVPLTITVAGMGSGVVTSSPPGIDCGYGQTDCAEDYAFGTVVTLTASPLPNSVFVEWGGYCHASTNPVCQVEMTGPGRDGVGIFERVPHYQPDGMISRLINRLFVGNNIYNLTGSGQERSARIAPGHSTSYYVKVQNDGEATDTLTVTGPGSSPAFAIKYLYKGADVTRKVTGSGLALRDVGRGASRQLTLKVRARGAEGASKSWKVRATSLASPTSVDVVRASATIR